MPRAAVRRLLFGASTVRLLAAGLLAFTAVLPAGATEVKIFRTQSQRGFLAGTLDGIGVDRLGRLRLADRSERLTAIGEPFLLSAAAHPQGWVVGTGNAGRVLLVRPDGRTELLFTADEPEIFAVWAAEDGTVFAGSSPGGKVYRIPAGGGEAGVWFDPGQTYVWDLAPAPGGGLLVATGTDGKLFHVTAEGVGEVVYDSEDTHLRTIAVLPDGDVLVGTAGEGLLQVLEPRPDGWRVRTLYDASEPEVVALAIAPDGTRYAAVAASEASPVDLSASAAGRRPGEAGERDAGDGGTGDGDAGDGSATITVTPEGSSATPGMAGGSRPSGFRGPRSQVLAVSPTGVVESLWSFEDETVFDLLWHRGRLWVATGLDGELYSWTGSQMVLEKDVDERQIVALAPAADGPAFATTNAAALYRVTAGTEREGVYTSATLDAEQISRFGTFRWRGDVPRQGGVSFSFRSGISSEPDRTWTEWSEWTDVAPGPATGGEVALGAVPRGRYAQWRARLAAGDGASPLLYGIELTYRQENLRPKIERVAVLEPGRILVPASFNPSDQAFEPSSPGPDGLFRTLEPAPTAEGRLKSLWKPGYRSLTWDADDDNGDELAYRLSFRPAEVDGAGDAADGDGGEGGWLAMVDELSDRHYVFDSTVLPDGLYRFRLEASDRPANPPGEALVAEQVSEPVVVDHTPPRLVAVERVGEGRLRLVVEDALSPLTRARLSVDAGEWTDLRPEDGLLDGRRETFVVDVPAGSRLILLQVVDAAYNSVTHDLLGR
ncbi:MAG TPA: hypothetical protein VM617_04480 [Thermoanaerobaculia bacterium]|nr:hypothetical protein [Thermoanaerobaculia bacterium]